MRRNKHVLVGKLPHYLGQPGCGDDLVTRDDRRVEFQGFSDDQSVVNIWKCGQRLNTESEIGREGGKTDPEAASSNADRAGELNCGEPARYRGVRAYRRRRAPSSRGHPGCALVSVRRGPIIAWPRPHPHRRA